MSIQFSNPVNLYAVGPGNARGVNLVVLGDSQTDRCSTFTNQFSSTSNAIGYLTWLQTLSRQAFYCPQYWNGSARGGNNQGVSGDTVVQMQARLSTVLALKPDVVMFWGGTNDLSGATTTASVDTIFSTWTAIVESLIAAGIRVIVLPTMPRTDHSATIHLLEIYFNQLMQQYCAKRKEVVFVDILQWIVDPTSATGDAVSGYLISGIHTLSTAAYLIGNAIWNAIKGVYPSPALTLSSLIDASSANNTYGNLTAVGLMAGSGGTVGTGASGSFATGWTGARVTGSTMTVAGSKISRPDGAPGELQQIVCATTSTGADAEICAISHANVTLDSAGASWYQQEAEIAVTVASANFEGVYLQTSGGSMLSRTMPGNSLNTDFFPNATWSGLVRSMPFQAAQAGNAGAVRVVMDGTKTGSVTITVGRYAIRKIPQPF